MMTTAGTSAHTFVKLIQNKVSIQFRMKAEFGKIVKFGHIAKCNKLTWSDMALLLNLVMLFAF